MKRYKLLPEEILKALKKEGYNVELRTCFKYGIYIKER